MPPKHSGWDGGGGGGWMKGGMVKFQIDSFITFNMQILSSVILQATPAYYIIKQK